MARYSADDILMATIVSSFVAFLVTATAAWVRHLMWSVMLLAGNADITVGKAILAVLGAFVPPIGAVHGLALWFS